MTAFFFKGIPNFRMKGFCSVRDALDNLSNVLHLAELVNTCAHYKCQNHEEDFDFVIFSGSFRRALIKKKNGYFSMSIPFQIIDNGESIAFNYDLIGQAVDGQFISILRNAILTSREGSFSHDQVVCTLCDHFGLEFSDAILYLDAFIALLADDHGYFRFDDDVENANGDIHPRYHFDFFYKNTSSIKIGMDAQIDMNCFYSLVDGIKPKRYLR